MSVRLVQAPISLVYDEASNDEELYEREYHKLSQSDDDPIGQWLKNAKAKGETKDSDPAILNLLVELHRKIDNLERVVKNEKPPRISLPNFDMIESIGFGYFKIKDDAFETGKIYYGRIEMPVHPKRDVGVFFEAENSSLAKIKRMHDRDEKEWASYLTARERVLIREQRGAS